MNEDDIPTSELMTFRADKHRELKSLKAQVEQVESVLDGLDEILHSRIPAGLDSMAHVTPDGAKVTVKRKVTSRYQPAAGQSPVFWAWCAAESRWDLAGKTVLQSGIEAYLVETGELPPGIEKFSKEAASVTVTVGAPRA